MSPVFQVLYDVSASDPGYAYDPIGPTITVGPSIPVTKIHNSLITVPVKVTDNYKVLTSGVGLFNTSGATISDLVQVSNKEVTFNIRVTATDNISISAADFVGTFTSAYTSGYTITSAYVDDKQAPYITFKNHDPSDRVIISRGGLTSGTSGITYENTGSVRVNVYDPSGSISPLWHNVGLTSASVGFVDPNSIVQTVFPTTIEFDVWNISATGDVIVSAQDDAGNKSQASDGKWIIGCDNNDRLINLTEFLPSHLKGETVFDFLEFFEKFLNTMYTNTEGQCNHGILKKIERLASLHNPEDIDIEYLEFFASMMGYGVGLNKGDLGLFTVGTADPTDKDQIADQNRALRFVVQNLPNWYRIKTTRNAVKIMLYSFGIVGDLLYQYSNDYNNNWIAYDENPQVNITSVMPKDYYPTPHFMLNVDIGVTTPAWVDQVEEIIKAINSIRPINTVFDYISASLKITAERTNINIKTRNTLVYHVSSSNKWTI